MGLFGLTIPEAYGGLELTMEEEALAMIEMGRTSPAFRSVFGTTVGIGSHGHRDGRHARAEGAVAAQDGHGRGHRLVCADRARRGSDAASLRTSAVRDGDHYVVNGTKRYITNAPHASVFTLMARTNPADKGAGGVSAFIVDAKRPASAWARSTARWASAARTPATSSSTTCACRPPT
jgi:acyl-CoA dehydrogenase